MLPGFAATLRDQERGLVLIEREHYTDAFRHLDPLTALDDVEALYRDWTAHGERALERPVSSAASGRSEPVCRLVTEVLPFDYSQFGSLPGVA